jgi:hypothetical protein
MKQKWLFEGVVALLIVLFTYTAVSKYLAYEKFVHQMQLAPVPLLKGIAPVLGWVMPAIEIIIVCLLLFNQYKIWGIYASLCLLVLFELYISAMLLSGLRLPCTCGGIVSKMTWKQHLLFNAVFILLCILAIVQYRQYKRSFNPTPLITR